MGGIGRIFRRGKKGILWIAYYDRGKEIRESTRSTNQKLARRLLNKRLADVLATGKLRRPLDET